MPKMSDPATVGAPAAGIAGSDTSTPLLSWGNSQTGFWSCFWRGTAVAAQGAAAGQEKYTGGAPPPVQPGPQSWRKKARPRMPLAPSADTVSAAVPPL